MPAMFHVKQALCAAERCGLPLHPVRLTGKGNMRAGSPAPIQAPGGTHRCRGAAPSWGAEFCRSATRKSRLNTFWATCQERGPRTMVFYVKHRPACVGTGLPGNRWVAPGGEIRRFVGASSASCTVPADQATIPRHPPVMRRTLTLRRSSQGPFAVKRQCFT